MRIWHYALLALFLVFSVNAEAFAKSETYKFVTLDLPAGWTVASAPNEADGAYSVVFAREDRTASMSLLIGGNQDEKLAVIAEALGKSMGADGAPVANKGQFRFSLEKDGMEGRAVVAEDKGQVMLTLLFGNLKDAESLAKRLKSRTHAGLLPKF